MLALEASRLARSSVDWHRLVEICVVTKTLLADESAVYDPRDPNDRLLLGVKGTLSEAELLTIRCRLHDGRWNKARRGELAQSLPVGYVRTEAGAVVKHPDRQVQARLALRLRPVRRAAGRPPGRRSTAAGEADRSRPRSGAARDTARCAGRCRRSGPIMRLLHNPTYAGAYAYGQKEYDPFDRSPTNGKAKTKAAAAGRLAGVPARRVPGLHHLGPVRAEPADAARQLVPPRQPRGPAERARRCSRGSSAAAGAGRG